MGCCVVDVESIHTIQDQRNHPLLKESFKRAEIQTLNGDTSAKTKCQQVTNLFLEEVLSVLEGAEFELLVLMLQLFFGGSEVENEVLE